MSIRMLAASVAAGIAAGEVIERPASVVKELVENSLDAGARSISVEIEQGGLQNIRVTDDGCGIVDDEIELAFERHATSKLQTLEDLARIATLGFRGEALASVAAAARVRLSTRASGAEAASVIEVEGSSVLRRGRESGAPGTTVHVEALFSTIPARLKFIRSTGAETARVRQAVEHLAMANPDVRLSLRADGRNLGQTTGNGGLRDVVAAVLGSDLADAMIDVAPSARAAFPVRGLVSPPDRNKPNRTGISLFVNGRWIFSSTLSVAVQEAYRGMLMEGRFPVAVLFIDAPPEAVDVNVHPNKREVRFIRDGDAFSSVERSVREALLGADPVAEARGLFPTQRAGHGRRGGAGFRFHARSQHWRLGAAPGAGPTVRRSPAHRLAAPAVRRPERVGGRNGRREHALGGPAQSKPAAVASAGPDRQHVHRGRGRRRHGAHRPACGPRIPALLPAPQTVGGASARVAADARPPSGRADAR